MGYRSMSQILVSHRDEGRTVQARCGDQIVVRLPENPTTGFQWAVVDVAESALTLENSDYEPAPAGGLGGGGVAVHCFRARAAGSGRLRLVLRQEWEPDALAERFEVAVVVRDA